MEDSANSTAVDSNPQEQLDITPSSSDLDKVLIFCHNLALLDLLQVLFQKLNIPALRMDGGTPMQQRIQLVKEFQTGRTQIFLLTAKVGGVGLNLTAANKVFLLQPNWNPAVDQQAIERSWRIG